MIPARTCPVLRGGVVSIVYRQVIFVFVKSRLSVHLFCSSTLPQGAPDARCLSRRVSGGKDGLRQGEARRATPRGTAERQTTAAVAACA